MRRRLIAATGIAVAMLALALVPSVFAGKYGHVVAKASAVHGKSKVAVTFPTTVKDPGRLSLKVTTRPKHKPVSWIYTTDCTNKYGQVVRFPKPGKAHEKTSRAPFVKHMRTAVKHPTQCVVGASAKLGYKDGKAVKVKIFNK